MSSRRIRAAAVILATAIAATSGTAGEKSRPIVNPDRRAGEQQANARFARIALHYSPVSGVLRSKGVEKVTNPHPGIYCIKPIRKLDTTRFVASVSVDWFESDGADVLAHWAGLAVNCPDLDRWFQVRTYDRDARDRAYPTPSNGVAFTFIVP